MNALTGMEKFSHLEDKIYLTIEFAKRMRDEKDRLEREVNARASSFYYRLLEARTGRYSTALATNIDFSMWGDYLGDPPLATAFLDRLVDGAVILKLSGRSYRAHRARPAPETDQAD